MSKEALSRRCESPMVPDRPRPEVSLQLAGSSVSELIAARYPLFTRGEVSAIYVAADSDDVVDLEITMSGGAALLAGEALVRTTFAKGGPGGLSAVLQLELLTWICPELRRLITSGHLAGALARLLRQSERMKHGQRTITPTLPSAKPRSMRMEPTRSAPLTRPLLAALKTFREENEAYADYCISFGSRHEPAAGVQCRAKL